MKYLKFLLCFTGLFSLKIYAQNNGLTTDTCKLLHIGDQGYTSFISDNLGIKWMGFKNTSGGSASLNYQLLRFDGSHWDTIQNVPSHTIYTMAVDAANILWLGTDSGLIQYNGSTFTHYSTSNSNIASNRVVSLACGAGKVYAGTHAGLCIFNGSTFTNYSHSGNGLSHDTILSIAYENPTSIWLGNAHGLELFYGSGFSFYYNLGGLGADSVTCIYIDAQQSKWMGTNHHGVVKFDNLNFKTMSQLYGPLPTQTGVAESLVWPNNTNTLAKGENGGVCFLGKTGGLIEIANNQVYNYSILYPTQYLSGISNAILLSYDAFSGYLYAGIDQNSFYFWHKIMIVKFDKSQYSLPFSPQLCIDINEVQGRITGNSDFGWDNSLTQFFVPKQTPVSPLHFGAMWLSAYNNGSLYEAASWGRNYGLDFWPGTMDTTTARGDSVGLLNPNTPPSMPVWKVNRYDVANFIYNWNHGNVQNGTFIPPPNFLSWPGNGTANQAHFLAPYTDVNHNGIYDPILGGDYPLIKGDQMLWWVFNDNTAPHSFSGGLPLGVEVQASAYAFTCPAISDSDRVLNYTTFYNYKIINRSNRRYDSTYIGILMDVDLGYAMDDYIGCDVMNNFGYVYNGDDFDYSDNTALGYLNDLPAFSCNILNGPAAQPGDGIDNNNNGIIDESNEKCMMFSYTYFDNTGNSNSGNPSVGVPLQFANFPSGLCRNGSPFSYGNHGFSGTPPYCRHVFPGLSDPYGISMGGSSAHPIPPPSPYNSSPGWTCQTGGVLPNDLRFVMGVGPFTMMPQGSYDLDYALVFSQDSANCTGASHLCILPRMLQDNLRVKNWFQQQSFPSCLNLTGVGVKDFTNLPATVTLFPNPTTQNLYISLSTSSKDLTIEIFDSKGNLVRAGTFTDVQKSYSIPVQDLSPGIYLAKISTSGICTIRKFVKE